MHISAFWDKNERQNISSQILCEDFLCLSAGTAETKPFLHTSASADSGSAEARALTCAHHPRPPQPAKLGQMILFGGQLDDKLTGDGLFQPDSRFLTILVPVCCRRGSTPLPFSSSSNSHLWLGDQPLDVRCDKAERARQNPNPPFLGPSLARPTAVGEKQLCCWISPPERRIPASVHSGLFLSFSWVT